ncbi:hypothetical protein BH20VER1_BH20VER1_24430 [soil metagenome]
MQHRATLRTQTPSSVPRETCNQRDCATQRKTAKNVCLELEIRCSIRLSYGRRCATVVRAAQKSHRRTRPKLRGPLPLWLRRERLQLCLPFADRPLHRAKLRVCVVGIRRQDFGRSFVVGVAPPRGDRDSAIPARLQVGKVHVTDPSERCASTFCGSASASRLENLERLLTTLQRAGEIASCCHYVRQLLVCDGGVANDVGPLRMLLRESQTDDLRSAVMLLRFPIRPPISCIVPSRSLSACQASTSAAMSEDVTPTPTSNGSCPEVS